MMTKNPKIKTKDDKIHMDLGSLKSSLHVDMVAHKTELITKYKNVTQTILVIAVIQVSCGSFVKVFSGIMAFSVKGINMKMDLVSDKA